MTEGPWLFNHLVAFNFVFLSQLRRTFLLGMEIHTSVASSKQNGSEKLSWLGGCLVLIIILDIYCTDFQVMYGLSKEDFLFFQVIHKLQRLWAVMYWESRKLQLEIQV